MIDLIIERANQIGIKMSREQAEKFEAYHALLAERNRCFNLTAVPEDIEEAVDRNYLDCIAVLGVDPLENVRSVIDVGSGAGFPGVPMAIMCPKIHFTLMDAIGKRVDFLSEVIEKLGLCAQAVHSRAEDGAHRPEYRESFDIAVARGVAPVNILSEYLLPFVRVGGSMMLLKGPNLAAEMEDAQNALSTLGGGAVREFKTEIPGRDWDHRVVFIEKKGPTPEKFPRRAGKPEKKPL